MHSYLSNNVASTAIVLNRSTRFIPCRIKIKLLSFTMKLRTYENHVVIDFSFYSVVFSKNFTVYILQTPLAKLTFPISVLLLDHEASHLMFSRFTIQKNYKTIYIPKIYTEHKNLSTTRTCGLMLLFELCIKISCCHDFEKVQGMK